MKLINHPQHKSQRRVDLIQYRHSMVKRCLQNCFSERFFPLLKANYLRGLPARVIGHHGIRTGDLALTNLVGITVRDLAIFLVCNHDS